MIQKERKSTHTLTESDLVAILWAAGLQSPDNPWHESGVRMRNLIVLMLLFTGMRSKEILQMRISDIDLISGCVRMGHPSRLKRRTVLLPPHLLDLFESYLVKELRPATDHDYVFVSHGSGKRMTPQSFSRIFRKLREKVPGLPIKLTAHAFRRAIVNVRFGASVEVF